MRSLEAGHMFRNRVASRAGGVDRNVYASMRHPGSECSSPPARGAWIATEVVIASTVHRRKVSPPARGAWIATSYIRSRRPPFGTESPPARGAWIATGRGHASITSMVARSPPARGAWIATCLELDGGRVTHCRSRLPRGGRGSQLKRGMSSGSEHAQGSRRLPRGGRGSQPDAVAPEIALGLRIVASRAGGVDRNCAIPKQFTR